MAGEVEEKVIECIKNNNSFIVEAGAGSGKTWTLVHILRYIINEYGLSYSKHNKKIACITYTNVAKDEIINRIQDNPLVCVKTIHDFLWDIIASFNKELKEELIGYITERLNNDRIEISKKKRTDTQVYRNLTASILRYQEILEELVKYNGQIHYKEYRSWKRGIITHDEVIYIATKLINKYRVIKKLIQDTYPIIFIDEYQDTDKNVAISILENLKPNTSITFGFFGDYLQQIYGGSIGKIDAEKYGLKVITKIENFRCSREVIDILNKLRDDIQQEQSGKAKRGKCFFYYVNDESIDAENFVDTKVKKDFKLNEQDIMKKLYLTTRSVAIKNGYSELHDLYDERESEDKEKRRRKRKDQILKNKDNRDCPFANFLYAIEEIVELYNQNRIQMLLKKIPFEIRSFADKEELSNNLEKLNVSVGYQKIKDIFNFVIKKRIQNAPDNLMAYFKNPDLQDVFYNTLMNIEYKQFRNLYYTVKETSPFSTDHGTKGAEFDNVVCVINDRDWTQSYSFNKYLDGTDIGSTRYDKTKNLFYVICSRAKYNLAIVLLSELTDTAIIRAKELFGENFIS